MNRHAQQGMSLVVALFIIVVLGVMAAFAANVGASQRASENLRLASDRALLAARAGAEWAGTRALVNHSCVASRVITLTQGALNGFRVTVACSATSHSEGALNYRVYDVTSFAQYGRFGSAEYASRRLTARFADAP